MLGDGSRSTLEVLFNQVPTGDIYIERYGGRKDDQGEWIPKRVATELPLDL